MVVFFGAQMVLPQRTAANAAQVQKGRDIFNKNCFRCHGENGRGSEKFARIAGQQRGYLTKTLQRYRSASTQRSDPLMAAATSLLSDADVAALVAYVSSME
jgi:cytochrome c553